jgi:hypothetical protein
MATMNREARRRLKLTYPYSRDIDPAIALEILPDKIKNLKRQVTETALDLSVVSSLHGHDEAEVTVLQNRLGIFKAALAEYEARLAAMRNAAAKAAAGETADS